MKELDRRRCAQSQAKKKQDRRAWEAHSVDLAILDQMDGNRGIPMMMAVATYDQALAFRPELLSSGGDGVVRSQSVLQLQQSPCSPLWRGSMLVKVQSNSHISRTVFAPVPDPVLTGRVCSISYPRHVRTAVFGRDPCRISISGAALLVGSRK